VAYQSLLTERRKDLHERAAGAVETLFAESLESHYGELHTLQAQRQYREGGRVPASRGGPGCRTVGHAEAESNLMTALELLPTLPETIERDRKEIALRTTLAAVLIAKGFGASERVQLLERARSLCQRLGENRQLGPVLTNLSQVHLQQGRLRIARELAEESLRLAKELQHPDFLLVAYHNAGEVCFWTGEMLRAQEHFQQAISLCDQVKHRSNDWVGIDPWVLSSAVLSWNEQLLGRSDQALRRSLATVARAREASHLFVWRVHRLLPLGFINAEARKD